MALCKWNHFQLLQQSGVPLNTFVVLFRCERILYVSSYYFHHNYYNNIIFYNTKQIMTVRCSPWIRSFRMISQGQFLDDLFIRVRSRILLSASSDCHRIIRTQLDRRDGKRRQATARRQAILSDKINPKLKLEGWLNHKL